MFDRNVVSNEGPREVLALPGWLVLVCAGMLVLGGCSLLPREALRLGDTAEMPAARNAIGSGDDKGVEIELAGESPFLLYPLRGDSSQRLPDKAVTNLHLSEISLYDGLRLLLDGTGVALAFDGGQAQTNRYQAAIVNGLDGNLPDVVEKLSKAFGFFYRLESGVLHVTQEEHFAIELPPVLNDDSLASLSNTLQYLGAKDVYLDRNSRTLTFQTNRRRLDEIRQYVDRVRESRSMLVYDLFIYQVDLSDSNRTGITWNKFNLNLGPNSAATVSVQNSPGGVVSSSGFVLGVIYDSRHFALDALISFLKTQGTMHTVSQPRIAIMSGSKGKIRIGQSTRYVSKVGSNITGTAVSQTTVETSDVQTGLDLSVYGDLHDGTVYTKLSLSVTDLLQFNRFTALGTDLTLPQTADRTYNSTVRALPGDTILLGGLILERSSSDVSGLPVAESGLFLSQKQQNQAKSELVLVMKSRVVRFAARKVQ